MRTPTALKPWGDVRPLAANGETLAIDASREPVEYKKVADRLRAADLLYPKHGVAARRAMVPRLGLATPTGRTVAALRQRLQAIATQFLAADAPDGELRAYLDHLLPARTAATVDHVDIVANLLGIYAQLPCLDAIDKQAKVQQQGPDQIDREALRAVLNVVMLYWTLCQTYQLLLSPGALAYLDRRQREFHDDDEDDEDTDTMYYAQAVRRFLVAAERRLQACVGDALFTIGDVVRSGAYGVVDWEPHSAAIPPLLRAPVLELAVIAVEVRVAIVRLLLGDYLRQWRDARGPGTVFGAVSRLSEPLLIWARGQLFPAAAVPSSCPPPPGEEVNKRLTEAERAMTEARLVEQMPRLFHFRLAASVIATLGHMTVGAAHYASLLTACGLDLETNELRQFCVRQALRGGIPGGVSTPRPTGMQALVRIASDYAHPNTRLGLPIIMAGSCLDAQRAVQRWLDRLDRPLPPFAGLDPLLRKWLERLDKARTEAELQGSSIDDSDEMIRDLRPSEFDGVKESAEPSVEAQCLFLNAVQLKYALRDYLQRTNVI